jgi:hypothetical protein
MSEGTFRNSRLTVRALRIALTTGAACAASAPAWAHVSDRGFVLLLPTGHYLAGGAIAVAASFAVLALMPATATAALAHRHLMLARGLPRGRTATSLVSFLALAVLVLAGWLGSRDPLSNPLPLVVWTLMWVGLTLVQGLVGNLWWWIDPWYGPWRLLRRLVGDREGRAMLHLPASAGYWPALFLFFGFAWFELIDPAPDDPARLATVVAAYYAANLVAIFVFGHDRWSRRGECLSAFFGLISRYAPIGVEGEGREARTVLRFPGAGIEAEHPLPPSGALFLLLTLASVSFDGLSRTFSWLAANGVNPLEFPGRTAMTWTNTLGLLATFAVLSAAYLAAVAAGQAIARSTVTLRRAGGLFVWSIVPIALAYHFSHYLTVLMVNGQYALVALSDPFAAGWNLFGTADMQVVTGVTLGAEATWVVWNLQAGAIVAGHVLAVLAAHRIATRLHPQPTQAALSEAPLTFLMIAYTVFGLWLLSTPTGA